MSTYGYEEYGHTAHFLGFDSEVRANLPAEGGHNSPEDWLDAEILDLKTGITYKARHTYFAVEQSEDGKPWIDEECNFLSGVFHLHEYFYHEHWCGCHRMSDIEHSNPGVVLDDDSEDRCPSGRFFVTKLTHRSMPELVLMYEDVPK